MYHEDKFEFETLHAIDRNLKLGVAIAFASTTPKIEAPWYKPWHDALQIIGLEDVERRDDSSVMVPVVFSEVPLTANIVDSDSDNTMSISSDSISTQGDKNNLSSDPLNCIERDINSPPAIHIGRSSHDSPPHILSSPSSSRMEKNQTGPSSDPLRLAPSPVARQTYLDDDLPSSSPPTEPPIGNSPQVLNEALGRRSTRKPDFSRVVFRIEGGKCYFLFDLIVEIKHSNFHSKSMRSSFSALYEQARTQAFHLFKSRGSTLQQVGCILATGKKWRYVEFHRSILMSEKFRDFGKKDISYRPSSNPSSPREPSEPESTLSFLELSDLSSPMAHAVASPSKTSTEYESMLNDEFEDEEHYRELDHDPRSDEFLMLIGKRLKELNPHFWTQSYNPSDTGSEQEEREADPQSSNQTGIEGAPIGGNAWDLETKNDSEVSVVDRGTTAAASSSTIPNNLDGPIIAAPGHTRVDDNNLKYSQLGKSPTGYMSSPPPLTPTLASISKSQIPLKRPRMDTENADKPILQAALTARQLEKQKDASVSTSQRPLKRTRMDAENNDKPILPAELTVRQLEKQKARE